MQCSPMVAGFLRSMVFGPERAERRDIHGGPSFTIGDPALAEYFSYGGRTLAGVSVDDHTAVGLTAVYRAVAMISGTIAGLPLRSYRTKTDGTREQVSTFLDAPSGPGGPYTQFEWLELVMVHLLLHGNAFLQHIYGGAGQIVGLMPIVPTAVTIRRVSTAEDVANYGGPDGTYRKWFEVQLADNTTRRFTCAELTHIPAMGLDGVEGLSPIDAQRQAIGTAIAGDRAMARQFGSGMLLAGLVSVDEDVPEEDAKAIIAKLKEKASGHDHAGELAFVNAKLNFTPWTATPVDAQFNESRLFQINEVSRIFGVPKVLLSEDGASTWGSGIAQLLNWMSRTTLQSWTTRIEQRLSLLLTRPTACEFDYKGLLQPSPEVEIPLLLSEHAAGVMTTGEVREFLGLPPLPAGAAPDSPLVDPGAPADASTPAPTGVAG